GRDAALRRPWTAQRAVPTIPPAFTLIELLVVIAIIGILAAISLPAIRGMTKSNAVIASNRQFLDDLALARQSAIAGHTTVYVIFIPTNITQMTPPANALVQRQFTNLLNGQYTTYALLELRQIGEQPGQSHARYLTGWRSLPNGVFIAQSKFNPGQPGSFPTALGFPFPVATN